MSRFHSVILLCSVLAGLPEVSLQKKDIDWDKEIIRQYNRFESKYGAHNIAAAIRDSYSEDFVYISLFSIIQYDFEDMLKHFTARSKVGRFEAGPPHIVFTCGNTAMAWKRAFFTDGQNLTREGNGCTLYEYVNKKAIIKLIQFTV